MPVQIQCFSVIIRNEALDRCLEGGAADFETIAPNAMSYGDDRLSQASFMSAIDAEEYAKSLELRGLNRSTHDPDFVIVSPPDQSVHPTCDWLILFEYEGRQIATIVGSDSTTVIAPATGGNPSDIQHFSAEEVQERLEFVKREGDIDVFRDKVTGQLLYHTRQTETDDEILRQAFEVIWENRRQPGTPAANSHAQTALSGAIEKLQSLSTKYPDASNVALGLGMAWFAKGNSDRALQAFARASQNGPDEVSILKEWAGVCLDTNDLAAALDLGRRAVVLKPDDPELLGNYAVIQLLNGRVQDAVQTISHARQLNPGDQVNHSVQGIITEVNSGKRPCPKSLREMMKPAKPRSLFKRIFGLK